MHYSVKLLIPVGLGLAAAALNYMTVQTSLQEVEFIAAKKPIKTGQLITESDLVGLPLPEKFREGLSRAAPTYSNRGSLSGQRASHDIPEGEILFYQDTAMNETDQGVTAVKETSLTVRLGRNTEFAGLFRPQMDVYFRVSVRDDNEVERFQRIGPFRLLSVGSGKITGMGDSGDQSVIDQVSVAFNVDDPSENERILEKFLDAHQRGTAEDPRIYPVGP